MSELQTQLTDLLASRRSGEDQMEQLLPYVYDELLGIARSLRRGERPNHTLDTSALVHEAYFKLVDAERTSWDNRAHFFGAAARAMRQVLVDYARARNRLKRGGGQRAVTLEEHLALPVVTPNLDLLALDDALQRLERLDPRQCRVVECRYFAGMTHEETAAALGLSLSTVKREWTTARAWLYDQLRHDP